MPRGVAIYIAIVLGSSWVLGGLVWLLQNSLTGQAKGLAGLLFLFVAVIPFATVFFIHRSQAAGNAYAGLVWGPTGWYWLLYLGGFLLAALVLGAQLAIGALHIDPTMGDYIAMNKAAALKSSGQKLPDSVNGTFVIVGWVTAWSALILGPWLGTAFGALGVFPQYGWLARRLMVRNRAFACIMLMLISAGIGVTAGLLDNPQMGDLSLPARMALFALTALAPVPATFWVFLRTRSAVLAAMVSAAYGAGMTASFPFVSDYAVWLSSPQGGVASAAGILLLGIGLWVWQDPGGQDLTVAAVAQDGTPLTPAMLQQAQAYAVQGAGNSPPSPPLPQLPPAEPPAG